MTKIATSIPLVLQLGGETIFKGEINLQALLNLASSPAPAAIHQSTPLTKDQVRQLTSKIDNKTIVFLRRFGENNGKVTFAEMCEIFGIEQWTEYATRFGKGLTRALRHMTNDTTANLVWWNDKDWASSNDPEGEVYIDGPALVAIKEAMNGR